MYSLRLNPAQHRIDISFNGHMVQDAETFFGELTSAALSVRSHDGIWTMLVDLTGTPVMPQDRAQNSRRIFEWSLDHNIFKIAIVSRSITQTMQLKRISQNHPVVQVFRDVAEAERWLSLKHAA